MIKCNDKIGKQARRSNLNVLFDSQIAILEDRGIPKQIIMALQGWKDFVLEKTSKIAIGKGSIPFLPVITPIYLGYYGLMSKVQNGFGIGYSSIKPDAIIDGFGTSSDLYYIYDVEVGKATIGKSPEESRKIFKKQSRHPMTAVEIINLCIITKVLWRRSVWATGSRYAINEQTPIVFLDDLSNPVLGCFYDINWNDNWGSPSCGSR
ncbi:MAG: hypothetical protein AAB949_00505 [Patescibacteria group bacterium]